MTEKYHHTSYGNVKSVRQLINDYVFSIPFEVRRESIRDREMRYIDFKNWMIRDLNIDSGPDYDYGVKRMTWKLLI